jgi:glycine C-acetyltransferase
MSTHQYRLEPATGSAPLSRLINRLLDGPELRRARTYSDLLDGFHLKNTLTTEVNGRKVVIDGKPVINFGSANYLGFEHHPAILKAAREALTEWGNHSGCSRIFSSHENIVRLENNIAELVGAEAVMVCANTSQTHEGVIPALFSSPQAVIFLDRYAHTSMYQAAQIAVAKGAKVVRVDIRDLEDTRSKIRSEATRSVRVMMVDGVYSMQGHVPDLKGLQALCDSEDTILYIDDAHGIGIYGENGGGVVEMLGLSFTNMILVGTLQKGLGCFGGFIAGHRSLIDALRICSRSYVFSGTLQPQAVEAGLVAIELSKSEEGKAQRARLHANSTKIRRELQALGFKVQDGDSPIISVLIGAELKTLLSGRKLFDEGIFLNSVLYPATPKGEGLLRISLNSIHTDEEIATLITGFAALKKYLADYRSPFGDNLTYAREFVARQFSRRFPRAADRVKTLGL